MANKENPVKKVILVSLFIGMLVLCAALLNAREKQTQYQKTPYDCLKKSTSDLFEPSKMLYQESLDTGFDIVIYADRRGLYNFAVVEKTRFGYKMVGISGSLSFYNDDTYHYSCFSDVKTMHNIIRTYYNTTYHNVCWGILTDDKVKEVFFDDEPCNIAELTDNDRSFRVFWLMDFEVGSYANPKLPALIEDGVVICNG